MDHFFTLLLEMVWDELIVGFVRLCIRLGAFILSLLSLRTKSATYFNDLKGFLPQLFLFLIGLAVIVGAVIVLIGWLS